VELASQALALDPDLVEARYNRGCWRVAAGDLDGALVDIQAALLSPLVDPITTALDPDLAPLLAAFPEQLPKAELACGAEIREDAVFMGSEWTVSLGCTHRVGQQLSLEGPDLPAFLQHTKTVQRTEAAGALQRTVLDITFVVRGAGEGTLGPWTGQSEGVSGVVPEGSYRFLAPEGHGAPDLSSSAPWATPSVDFQSDGAHRDGALVRVRADPGDRITWEASDVVRVEKRTGDTLEWVGWVGTLDPGASLSVHRGKTELYKQQP
jgi:hypothetical protein